MTTAKPVVLFACIHNAGRSVAAKVLAEHYAQGHVHVLSAGSEPGGGINTVVAQVLAERGLTVDHEVPKKLELATVEGADVVITMGCGDACPIFPGKRYEDWELTDPAGLAVDEVRPIRDDIEQRVRALLAGLG